MAPVSLRGRDTAPANEIEVHGRAARTGRRHLKGVEVLLEDVQLRLGPVSAPVAFHRVASTSGLSSQVRPSSSRPPALGVRPPHCLKKNGDARLEAAVSDVARPPWLHRAGARTALAADDDPVDPLQVEVGQRAEERFDGQEPDCCGDLSKMIGAELVPVVLDADAHPHVGRPGQGVARSWPGAEIAW